MPHMSWLWASLVHIKLWHRLSERKLGVRSHWGRVPVLHSRGWEDLRCRCRYLHTVMVIEMSGASAMMLLRMHVMRAMRRAGGRRHSRGRLLELEGHLALVRSLRIGRGAALR